MITFDGHITQVEQIILRLLRLAFLRRLPAAADLTALAARDALGIQDGALVYVTAEDQVYEFSSWAGVPQALPTVVRIGANYHMFFCYRHTFDFRTNPERGYRIGHAWSEDLVTWHRSDDDPLLEMTPGHWDSDMNCYPHVCEVDGRIFLLYNGNQFGREGFGLAVLEP